MGIDLGIRHRPNGATVVAQIHACHQPRDSKSFVATVASVSQLAPASWFKRRDAIARAFAVFIPHADHASCKLPELQDISWCKMCG